MESISNWSEVLLESVQSFGQRFMGAMPSILGGLLILLLGWLMAKALSKLTEKLLTSVKFNDLAEKVGAQELLEKANTTMSASALIGRFIYWIIMLLVLITVSETMGWHAVSIEISKLLSYLPTLFAAILFFIIGVYIATFVRNFIRSATSSLGIGAGKALSAVVFYLLVIIVSLTSLDQAGIDTSIITSNLLIIIGSLLAAFAISYGFASRDILSNILASLFSKRTFKIGQVIEVNGIQGEIVEMSSISITLKQGKDKIVIPTQTLINSNVKIIG